MLVEIPPESCSSGHPFKPQTYSVGFLHCKCEGVEAGIPGHREYTCRTCGETLVPGWHVVGPEQEWRKHGAFTAFRTKPGAEPRIRGGATWRY